MFNTEEIYYVWMSIYKNYPVQFTRLNTNGQMNSRSKKIGMVTDFVRVALIVSSGGRYTAAYHTSNTVVALFRIT